MKKKMISVLIALAVSLSTVLAGASAQTQAEAGTAVSEETEIISEEEYSKITEENITDQKEEIQEEETEDHEDQTIPDQENSHDNSETGESQGENLSEEIPTEEVSFDQSSSEKTNSEEEDLDQPEDVQTDIPQENEAGSGSYQEESDEIQNISEEPLLFTEENAELLSGDSKDEKELVEQIRDGEIIGVAPAFFMGKNQISDSAELSISDLSHEEDAAIMALQPGQYHVEKIGRVYCDEVWTAANDYAEGGNYTRIAGIYREIHYVDETGKENVSPLYCMKASKAGLGSTDLRAEAVRFLSDSNVKKLLYFGYGGPGDLGISYVPSCEHINWARWENRYVFTHIALSKIYAGDLGQATEAEAEHVGINRFISKIRGMTIPERNKASISMKTADGWTSTAGKNVPLSLFKKIPSHMPYVYDKYKNGFQLSPLLKLTDSAGAGNSITVTRPSSAGWQFVYWKNAKEYSDNLTSPHVLEGSVTLKNGYIFLYIFPVSVKAGKFTYKMNLTPVSYILVDGPVQTGNTNTQDFGAFVYQGTRGQITLNYKPAVYGRLVLTKTATHTGEAVPGAKYTLYAGEDLKSGVRTVTRKDTAVSTWITNDDGQITYVNLIPGKYYVRETTAAKKYLLSTVTTSATVKSGTDVQVKVKNVPDIKGKVSIEKLDGDNGDPLKGAEFTLFEWSQKLGNFIRPGKLLTYNSQSRRYELNGFSYTTDNMGIFRVRETKPPKGYRGSWYQDFKLKEAGTTQVFKYQVKNYTVDKKHVEVRKTDEDTGKNLEGAEFRIYEYSISAGKYKIPGTLLSYDKAAQRYVSGDLTKTADNAGKFRVKETKNPTGYEGTWKQDVDISKDDAELTFTVTNKEIRPPQGMIYIQKEDLYTRERLKGAEFTVYQWNASKNVYEDTLGSKKLFRYDEDGQEYYSQKLDITDSNLGKFKIKETRIPTDYTGRWEKEIVLKASSGGSTAVVRLKADNTPVHLPLGSVTIIKKIPESEITWAHGNPTFFFVVDGKDLSGKSHRYEDYVEFEKENYETDANGYAWIRLTIENIPLGKYQIYEKNVLRYYLQTASANTDNVKITKGKAPAYGVDPKEIACGTAALTMEKNTASITFVNRKQRYDDYSHNDCIRNTVPLLFQD